jgi:hypothetical protein
MTAGRSGAQAGATLLLLTLAAGQFLMTLDTSVMNVAIATVAESPRPCSSQGGFCRAAPNRVTARHRRTRSSRGARPAVDDPGFARRAGGGHGRRGSSPLPCRRGSTR